MRCLALLAGLCLACVAWAQIAVSGQQFQLTEEGYAVSADFRFDLSARLEEAVARGVVLHFLVEFDLYKPRWYWLNEKVLSRQKEIRLSYHALTRQYRVWTGGLHQTFVSLSDALRMVGRVHLWQVAERSNDRLRAGDAYEASLRFRLDNSQLPKPFQLAALGSRDWNLASEWSSWNFILPAGETR